MTKHKITPVQYRGYIFHDKIEAKWAVFFSILDIPYQYEPNTFTLESGRLFTPTFYLPVQDAYVKVFSKPRPDLHDTAGMNTFFEFANSTDGARSFAFIGDLPDWASVGPRGYTSDDFTQGGRDGIYLDYAGRFGWTRCACGVIDLQFKCRMWKRRCSCADTREYAGDDPAILYAYRYAKAFNFGAAGSTTRGER